MLTLEAILLICLIGISLTIVLGKNLLVSVIIYCAFSFVTMFLYIVMGAPDVAFTEAVIGVVSTVFFIMMLKSIDRKTK